MTPPTLLSMHARELAVLGEEFPRMSLSIEVDQSLFQCSTERHIVRAIRVEFI